jgi:alkyl hydroperoxide reductase subunit AhpC
MSLEFSTGAPMFSATASPTELAKRDHLVIIDTRKKMYGKEFEGVVRSTVLIDPKGMVKAAWPKASSKGHAREVLDALDKIAG